MEKMRYVTILLISICFLITGCSESPDYIVSDVVQEDLLGAKGINSPKEVFEGLIKDGWVYYSNYADNQKIYKIRTDGTRKTKLNNHERCSVIDILDGWIYFNDCSTGYDSVYKMDTNGKNKTKIVGGSKKGCANGFKINGDWIYYSDWVDMYSIHRIKLDGSNESKLSTETYSNRTLYKDWIYYVDYFDRNVYRMKLDGTEKSKIYNSETYKFEIDSDFIYMLNASYENNDSKLYRINLDGMNKIEISSKTCCDFDISNGWIYYNGDQIGKMKLDGLEDTCIEYNGFSGNIWVVDRRMYFRSVNEHSHEIMMQKIE